MDQKAALATAQAEIARLNGELEKARYAATEMKTRFVEATKKQRETLDQSGERAHLAETGLALLRSRSDSWLSELTVLNRDLNSKWADIPHVFLALFLCCCFSYDLAA